jgi:MFS family permease
MSRKKTFFAGIFGNTLEWYDFTAYAFFAPILAKLFFPLSNPFTSLLLTFGVFALSFLVRPVGALFFGYIGDHFGRRTALIISIIVMSLPTLFLGLLPNYATIGIAAPVLLTILRMTQGLAVSGELTSATSFLVEHAHEKRRGFAGSLAMWSAFIGITLSSIVVTSITMAITDQQLTTWGWRVPFVLGGLLGFRTPSLNRRGKPLQCCG